MPLQPLTFDIRIAAPRERVWDVLWNDTTYPQWTAPFDPGSRAESDWQAGSLVHFLAQNGHGMIARIVETRRPEAMAFQHIGLIRDGQADFDSPEVQAFAGARETYQLDAPSPSETHLTVLVDTHDEYRDFMSETFPQALAIVRQLAEEGQ